MVQESTSGGVEAMIRVEGLTKLYGATEAVRDLSFRVEPGEVLGLVGPNGAGKTTTLRAIACIIPPTRGKIFVAGHPIDGEPLAAKRELAFIPDEPKLFDYLTVRDHLKFIARLYGVEGVDEKAAVLIRELELEGKEDALPATLSRGMKQKLAIACGFIHDPKAILFDEPLTGLDPMAIRRTKAAIRERAEGGASVIVSSHLLGLVEEISDRVLIIQNGRKIAFGPLPELKESIPELQADADLEEIFLRVTQAVEEAGRDGE
ncbi:MAG: ABC transporter ATP-binding protein [Planctomycetota bacterium]